MQIGAGLTTALGIGPGKYIGTFTVMGFDHVPVKLVNQVTGDLKLL